MQCGGDIKWTTSRTHKTRDSTSYWEYAFSKKSSRIFRTSSVILSILTDSRLWIVECRLSACRICDDNWPWSYNRDSGTQTVPPLLSVCELIWWKWSSKRSIMTSSRRHDVIKKLYSKLCVGRIQLVVPNLSVLGDNPTHAEFAVLWRHHCVLRRY